MIKTKKKNNIKNGFTLVELLAVITLLAAVGLIAIPVVNKSINDSKEKAYNAQVKEIENAAKNWISENLDEVDSEVVCLTETSKVEITTVTIATLKSNGYIPKKAKNPKTDEDLTGSVKVIYDCEYSSYEYQYEE